MEHPEDEASTEPQERKSRVGERFVVEDTSFLDDPKQYQNLGEGCYLKKRLPSAD